MKFFFSICLLILASFSKAQVIINEYSASNLRLINDDYENDEDWIELRNLGNMDVDLSGWYLSDKLDKIDKWKIPTNTIIKANSFLTFWASGRNSKKSNSLHTNFKFTQSNQDEYIVLSNGDATIIESTQLIVTQVYHSVGKDENGKWKIFETATPGFSNEGQSNFEKYGPNVDIITIAGFYTDSVWVDISPISDAEVRYTLDGTEPTKESELFTEPFKITRTTVVKARSFSTDVDVLPGFLDFATFLINEPASTIPVVCVSGFQAQDLANGDRELNPICSWEHFTKEGELKGRSYGELDSHGQDSWINPQRSLDWISRDQMGYDSGVKDQLFDYSKRDKYQRIILRASGDDNFPSVGDADHEGSTHIRDEYVHTLVQKGGMHMDVRAVARCILYLNGEYWGVYTMREKPDDHDYTDYTYNQNKYDLQFLKTWGESWAEYGGDKAFKDWGLLRDHILQNDMSDAENYQMVKDEMDVISLMDYMLANLSVVSSDWLNYNTGWWRGTDKDGEHKKWGYIMWDNDATFDYYINYSGVPNTLPTAKACDIDEISDFITGFFPQDTSEFFFPGDSFFIDGEWRYFPPDTFYNYPDPGKHEQIFQKLFTENFEFKNTYLARYTDMINTVFSCENMESKLDSLIEIIKPEMPRHITRWEGSYSKWNSNITKLKNFVKLRCKAIDDGLKSCYQLSGPFNITIVTDPPNMTAIQFNSLNHTVLPWSGGYFGNMTNKVAVAENVNGFKKWKSANGATSFSDEKAFSSDATITASDTIIAVFEGSTAVYNLEENQIEVSPNPNNGEFTIYYNLSVDANFEIVSVEGKMVKHGKLNASQAEQTIEGSDLIQGSYFVKVYSEQGVSTQKVIVVR